MNKLKSYKEIIDLTQKHKQENKSVGLILGCFDVFHIGHVEYINMSKEHVDILVVGLEPDENIRINKGKNKPIFKFEYRAKLLSAIEGIDYIFKVPFRWDNKIADSANLYLNMIKETGPTHVI